MAVETVTKFTDRPRTFFPFVVWLLMLLVIATVVLRVVDRQARRLLPLATLLRLSLVFPDQAPSRFSLALKSGTGRALERAVADATAEQEFGTPQETAETVVALIGAVGRHDRMTRGHCERVRAYSDLIGQQLGLDEESASKLHWAALLHDVGKLDVSPAVLNKKGRLTPEEWEHVREHPAHSDRWIGGLTPWLGEWVLAASQHHERFDGQGYPYGIAGMDISLAGRIVSVADAFDVMTAARSYKKPFPAAQARVELTDNAGSQFDPQIVRAFLAISVGELRRVMGPVAWLAALPELVRASVSGALAPARTAVIAAGVAAASLVPAVSAPMHVVITPAANAASGAATTFAAAEEGTNGGPKSDTASRTGGDSSTAVPATESATGGAPADGTATAATVTRDTSTTPSTTRSGGSSNSGPGSSNSGPGGGGGNSGPGKIDITSPASTVPTTSPPSRPRPSPRRRRRQRQLPTRRSR